MKLLLFDIDGTLLMSGGAGRQAMNRAFFHCYGFENGFQDINMMGRTDPLILKEALLKHHLPYTENTIFQRVYYGFLEEELLKPASNKSLCPGIIDLLKKLNRENNMILGLLTGNWQRGAYLKLRHFQIQDYFLIGAYADDAEERSNLIPVALHRFREKTGTPIDPSDVFVIGDTPLDIIAARPHHVRTVGVATGFHDLESIRKENPDQLFENLKNTERVVKYFKET
jgi:phosphoglycolate phosphatase